MATTWVLKLPQVDKPEKPILVHVTQKKASSVDLDLLATDGEEAFKGKVRQRNLAKLRSKNFEGTDEEWTALLRYTLVSKRDSRASEEQTRNLQVDCFVSGTGSKAILSITLRSRIEDITHKLGSIDLSYSENTDDVDLFGWACQIADQRDGLEEKARLAVEEKRVSTKLTADLETQLAELIKAKQEHEDQLLTKFAALLNQKKAKIRNQQRVLQTAKLDQKKLNELRLTKNGDQADAKASKRKRGSVQAQSNESSDDEESDGFEAMDVDKDPRPGEDEDPASGQETPLRSASPETETASEDEDLVSKPKLGKGKSKKLSPPPPPRSLPFQKKALQAEPVKKAAPTSSTIDGDAETESEDDEL